MLKCSQLPSMFRHLVSYDYCIEIKASLSSRNGNFMKNKGEALIHWEFLSKTTENHKRVTWDKAHTSLQPKFMFINIIYNTFKFKSVLFTYSIWNHRLFYASCKTNFVIIHWKIQCCSHKCGKFMFGSEKNKRKNILPIQITWNFSREYFSGSNKKNWKFLYCPSSLRRTRFVFCSCMRMVSIIALHRHMRKTK